MKVTCIGCRKTLNVPESMGGKRVPCPACETVNNIPTPDELDDLQIIPLEEDLKPPPAPPPGLEEGSKRGRKSSKPGMVEPHQMQQPGPGQMPIDMIPKLGGGKGIKLPIPWKPIVWAGTFAAIAGIGWMGYRYAQQKGWVRQAASRGDF